MVYWDKCSRIDGSACAHLELRFLNSTSVRRAGIDLSNLEMLDGKALLLRCVKFVEYDPEAFREKVMANTLAGVRGMKVGTWRGTDVWRDGARRRVDYVIQKLGLDTAQGIQEFCPSRASRLPKDNALAVITYQTHAFRSKIPNTSTTVGSDVQNE